MALEDDPTYQAYLRAIGMQSDTAQANAAAQTAQVQRRTNFSSPEIAFQGGIERENIANGYDARGVYGSGAMLRDQARQQHSEQYRQDSLLLNQSDTITGIQQSLAEKLAELERQKAEQALTTAGQQAMLTGLGG